jgi:hypothetical protein
MKIRMGPFELPVCAACGTTAAGVARMLALINGRVPKIPTR